MNAITVTGRLTRDVDFRTTPTGTNVCSFGIAVQRDYKNANGQYDADFFNVIAWRGTADFIRQYFAKGKAIEITGKLQSRSYTDQQGNKRIAVEIVADKAGFALTESSGKTAAAQLPETPQSLDNDFVDCAADEEYPF